jgi:phenylalanyl-tRNA synthetase alpha chain
VRDQAHAPRSGQRTILTRTGPVKRRLSQRESHYVGSDGSDLGSQCRPAEALLFVTFAYQLYGLGRRLRLRKSYFLFTEPSVEIDMDCVLCQSQGCPLCKYTGWLEILGAGMVHPVVLQNGGYDPALYSGFAFGMGPERVALLKHGIDHIRYFYSNDVRFLERIG